MSSSKATVEELHRAGITLEHIKAQIEKRSSPIEGQIVEYFLPEDGWNSDTRIRRAQTTVKDNVASTVGTVGIVVNEANGGDGGESVFYYFYNIESVLPGATQSDDATKGITTAADTSAAPADAADDFGVTDLMETVPDNVPTITVPSDDATDNEADDAEDDSHDTITDDLSDAPAIPQRLKMTIQFYGVNPPVPLERRRPITQQFWGRLRMSPIPFTRPLAKPIFGPQNRFATLRINFDTTRINKEKLKAKIIQLTKIQKWEGKVKISFV